VVFQGSFLQLTQAQLTQAQRLEGSTSLEEGASPRLLHQANAEGRLIPLCPDSVGQELPADVHDAIRVAEAILAASGGAWQPAAVLQSPKEKQMWTAADRVRVEGEVRAAVAAGLPASVVQPPQFHWLLGPWVSVPLDPTVWGHGGTALTAYTAKEGRQRITLLAAAKDRSVGEGALWPAGGEGADAAGSGL